MERRTKSSFVLENKGVITDCYVQIDCKQKKTPVNFSGYNKGTINKSYEVEEIKVQEIEKKETYNEDNTVFINIETKDQLIEIVSKINNGVDNYETRNFRLTRDIDLENIKIQPIGNSENHSFQGIFEGNGFTIHNINIANKKKGYGGFFGYIKNAQIRNLSIQGRIKGNGKIAGMAGKNDNGTISACTASVSLLGRGEQAGFVWENNGQIKNCYGKVKWCQGAALPAMCGMAAIAVICIGVFISVMPAREKQAMEYMPPIPVDQEAAQYDKVNPVNDRNYIDCEFATKLRANQKLGVIKVNFKNPGKSNKHMVMKLQITDQELIKKMGNNGRDKKEQKELDKKGYAPEKERILLGESGTIPPGYKLGKVKLNKLPNGKEIKKGQYDAIIVLSFYDIETNARSMINTQTPVKLIVQ